MNDQLYEGMNEDINLFINNYALEANTNDNSKECENKKTSFSDQISNDFPSHREVPNTHDNRSHAHEPCNTSNKKQRKRTKPSLKRSKNVTNCTSNQNHMTNSPQINQNYNTNNSTNLNPSISQYIYNNISSLFNIQREPTVMQNDDLTSHLLPLYLSEFKAKNQDFLASQILQKVMTDNSFAMNTVKTFCDFLDKNGYTIRKREGNPSTSSTAHCSNEPQPQQQDKSEVKRTMDVNSCPHSTRKHYAKNMCNNCYHKQGREKKAWLCEHTKKPHYAKGKCQNCYLNQYHESKVIHYLLESTQEKLI